MLHRLLDRWALGAGLKTALSALVVGAVVTALHLWPPILSADFALASLAGSWRHRSTGSSPVVLIAIDQAAERAWGTWPWDATVRARFLERLLTRKPLTLVLDSAWTHLESSAPSFPIQGAQWRTPPVLATSEVEISPGLASGQVQYAPGLQAYARDPNGTIWGIDQPEDRPSIPTLALSLGNPDHEPNRARPGPTLYISHSGLSPDLQISGSALASLNQTASIPDGAHLFVGREGPENANHPLMGQGIRSEIYVHAIATRTLQSDFPLVRIGAATGINISVLLILFVAVLVQGIAERRPILAGVAGTGLVLASFLGLTFTGFVWNPLPSLFGVALILSAISFRQLTALKRGVAKQVARLEAEKSPFPEPEQTIALTGSSTVTHHLQNLSAATSRIRNLRRFLDYALGHVPDPMLVITPDGFVAITNQSALLYFQQMGVRHPEGAQLPYLLSRFEPVEQDPTGFSWWDLIDMTRSNRLMRGLEVKDSMQRHWVVKCVPAYNAKEDLIGWIATFNEITQIRDAERRRDETLRFLSHDLRSPQSSILTLLELERKQGHVGQHEALFGRLEGLARRSLSLADNFVHLARAETASMQIQEIDLNLSIEEAIDQTWAAAKAKRITVKQSHSETETLILGDPSLIARALTNLVDNAIKYSAAGTTVRCKTKLTVQQDGTRESMVAVRDEGYGIAPEDRPKLFRRFSRVQHQNQPDAPGAGLGLAFVKTVVDRHRGRIEVASKVGKGTEFRLFFPAPDPHTREDLFPETVLVTRETSN